MKTVQEQNAKNEGFELGLNKFADLSDEEYEQMNGLREPLPGLEDDTEGPTEEEPSTLEAGL